MKIDASPTKEFFISMLTRDISLDRAILDLVDNSVDAAKASGIFKGKYVELIISETGFSIVDNCGGMDRETAEKRAFRFGRSKDAPPTPNSVGQFGVGMKRTLFKIGRKFEVISRNACGNFEIKVDVNAWLDLEQWEFDLVDLPESEREKGVEIHVTDLNDGVGDKFRLDTFVRSLITEIAEAHFKIISSGMKIIVNHEEVSCYELKVKKSDALGVAAQSIEIDGVTIRIIAGIGERDYNMGGWYIVCNGRLVSFAEKSKATAWGDYGIPKYHPDYAYFRGVVDMEATDSSKLPWTTTKTGIDVDNRAYRITLAKMVETMRPILAFLREREKETRDFKEDKVEITPLNDVIDNSPTISIYSVDRNSNFIRPEIAERIFRPEYTSVQYTVSLERMNIIKETSGAATNKEVGLMTFEYFFERECESE